MADDVTKTEDAEDQTTSEDTEDVIEEGEEETEEVDSFYDPADLPEELKPLYEEMHSKFTEALEGFDGDKEATDARIVNLEQMIQTLQTASHKGEGSSSTNDSDDKVKIDLPEEYAWLEEPLSKFADALSSHMTGKVTTVQNGLAALTQSTFSTSLDSMWPEWRKPENMSRLTEAMKADPQLILKPGEVVKKFGKKSPASKKSVKVKRKVVKAHSTGESASRATRSSEPRKQAKNFDEGFDSAWNELEKKGQVPTS